jgi:hypothetical protein
MRPDNTEYLIEPLDPEKHDRAAFSCGVEQVDNFFKRTANKLSKADNLRVFVMSNSEGSVIGFYALNAHSIEYNDLPAGFARNRPGHGNIPAAYISMIGRDEKYAKGGFGGDLLLDCLRRIALASDSIGLALAILDVLDDGVPELVAKRTSLYKGYGFSPVPASPLRLFITVATIRKLLARQD